MARETPRGPAHAVRRALRRWYLATRRDLPWRRTRDPYAILVSEVMLQQTTVAVAAPRFDAFLARFPTSASLAAASETEVLAAWSGLGYYHRARHLHRAARRLADGPPPATLEELRALPGVGAYTAAAVGSIALGLAEAAVDGNVARVVARLHALRAEPRSRTGARRIEAVAKELLDVRHPGDHNQAMMELGATVCRPRAPRCDACPLAAFCAARATGEPERFPPAPARRPSRRVRLAGGVAFRSGRLVLVPDVHLVRGHLVVPLVEVPPDADPAARLRRAWPRLTGRAAISLSPAGRVSHSVLDRRYSIELFRVTEAPSTSRHPSSSGLRCVVARDLRGVPHGGLLRKVQDLLARPSGPEDTRPMAN